MKHEHMYEQFRKNVRPAIKSKLEELEMLGYGAVTETEMWGYLLNKKWKNPKKDAHLFEIVADILAIKPGEYMNYATVEAFKLGSNTLSDEEERRKLLK